MQYELRVVFGGGFRHVQHVRPNRGPTKRGPTRGPAIFCLLGVMLTTLSLCVSCEFSRAVKSIKLTVMSKKVVSFWRKQNGRRHCRTGRWWWLKKVVIFGRKENGGIREGPHIFFLNRALFRLNAALVVFSCMWPENTQLLQQSSTREHTDNTNIRQRWLRVLTYLSHIRIFRSCFRRLTYDK